MNSLIPGPHHSLNQQPQYYPQQFHPYFQHQKVGRKRPHYSGNFIFPRYQSRYTTMLWDQTKQLPKETFNQIEQMYLESGFPMEVRLNLADFVESKFLPNAEIDDTTAANLANQLLSQLDAKIAATPNDADKFLHKKNLQELSDTLKVSKPTYSVSPLEVPIVKSYLLSEIG